MNKKILKTLENTKLTFDQIKDLVVTITKDKTDELNAMSILTTACFLIKWVNDYKDNYDIFCHNSKKLKKVQQDMMEIINDSYDMPDDSKLTFEVISKMFDYKFEELSSNNLSEVKNPDNIVCPICYDDENETDIPTECCKQMICVPCWNKLSKNGKCPFCRGNM